MDTPKIDRVYNLNNYDDRIQFFKKYSSAILDVVSKNEFFKILNFLIDEFGEKWVTVYDLGVSIETGDKKSKSMNFFNELLPLGSRLLSLKEIDGFDVILQKMKTPKQRESTILEINSVACYRNAGYEVVLEPRIEKGKHSDFKVKYNEEWIFFECKKEYYEESEYYKRYNKLLEKITKEIEEKLKTEIGLNYRLDIILNKLLNITELDSLINDINEFVRDKIYQKWIKKEEYEIAINLRDEYVDFHPLRVKFGSMTVGTTPTRVSDENMYLRIFYDPFGKGEIRKIQRILKDAKKQIPSNARGIIIFDVNHTQEMVDIVKEKIQHDEYSHIITVLLVGNGAWTVPTGYHKDIPFDFLTIPVIPYKN